MTRNKFITIIAIIIAMLITIPCIAQVDIISMLDGNRNTVGLPYRKILLSQ